MKITVGQLKSIIREAVGDPADHRPAGHHDAAREEERHDNTAGSGDRRRLQAKQ